MRSRVPGPRCTPRSRRDGGFAVNWWGTDTAGWIDCRHEELSKVFRDNHLGGQQLMEFGILRLGTLLISVPHRLLRAGSSMDPAVAAAS